MPKRISDRMSEFMPERMSDRMSEYICVYIYDAIYTSRWYVRNYVPGWGSLEESNIVIHCIHPFIKSSIFITLNSALVFDS